jgi:uncharacterized protein with HEPN domain
MEKLEMILECIDRIQEYTKDGPDAFFADTKTQDAVIRNCEVIGQAIKDLHEDLKQKNPQVEWREAGRFRDKITHHYLDIDYRVVWDVVETDLPPLRAQICDIHQRLIYKVPDQNEQPSKLQQKLRDKDDPKPI